MLNPGLENRLRYVRDGRPRAATVSGVVINPGTCLIVEEMFLPPTSFDPYLPPTSF